MQIFYPFSEKKSRTHAWKMTPFSWFHELLPPIEKIPPFSQKWVQAWYTFWSGVGWPGMPGARVSAVIILNWPSVFRVIQTRAVRNANVLWYKKPISHIPQGITPISHNASLCNRNVHTCTFLLQNGASWDIGPVPCGICKTGLYWLYATAPR